MEINQKLNYFLPKIRADITKPMKLIFNKLIFGTALNYSCYNQIDKLIQ